MKPCYLGYPLMKNHDGFIVDIMVTPLPSNAEREAAVYLAGELPSANPA